MMKSSGIGGQAVLEGVMMKNKNCYAIAVRKPDNEIEVKKEEFAGKGERRALFKVPIFRGMATFVESLVLGMHALTYSSSFYEEEEGQKEASKAKEALVDVGVVVLSVLMAVAVFILFPLFISSMLGRIIKSETIQLVVEGFLRLFMFIAYIALISRLNDIKRVFMYHGAEHKCINCVEQGYALTIANVKKQSKCHKRCGTSFMLVVMLVSFVLFMFIRVEETWLRYVLRIVLIPLVAGISYEFIRLAGNTENKIVNFLSRPGLWMQGLTTKEPDDSMIEVAIASVEAVFDWKAYQEKEGIAKYRKDSLGQAERKGQRNNEGDPKGSVLGKGPITPGAASGSMGRSERPVSTAPKDRKAERPSLGKRPEAKAADVSHKKDNSPAAGNLQKDDGAAGKSGGKIKVPIARAGIKEARPVARTGGAEKAMPRSVAKTIKPLGKAESKPERVESKPEKAAVRSGSQGEKPAVKLAAKGIKAAGKDSKGILAGNEKEEKAAAKAMKKDSQPAIQKNGQEIPREDEKASGTALTQIAERNAQNETPAGKEEAIMAKAEKDYAGNTIMPIKEEMTVKAQENTVREEIAKENQEISVNAEAAQEIAASEEAAGKVPENAASEAAGKTPENAAGETSENAAGKTQNKSKSREQDRRRSNLISFMSIPDDEEDDEILRALDRYFVYGEDGSEENQ